MGLCLLVEQKTLSSSGQVFSRSSALFFFASLGFSASFEAGAAAAEGRSSDSEDLLRARSSPPPLRERMSSIASYEADMIGLGQVQVDRWEVGDKICVGEAKIDVFIEVLRVGRTPAM